MVWGLLYGEFYICVYDDVYTYVIRLTKNIDTVLYMLIGSTVLILSICVLCFCTFILGVWDIPRT